MYKVFCYVLDSRTPLDWVKIPGSLDARPYKKLDDANEAARLLAESLLHCLRERTVASNFWSEEMEL